MPLESTSREFIDRIEKLSPKRLVLLAAELERRLAAVEESASQPIAVTGIGCRLPGGVETPEGFWELLKRGQDAIEVVPASRWDAEAWYSPLPGTPGKANTKWGGFVGGIDQFDAEFFGIAPREAVGLDPQQRMLLEVSWEALEDAGERAELLNGSQTGVFFGMSTNDYASLIVEGNDDALGAYSGTGLARSVAAGRVSYFLGLRGPNMSIDTACSSSAVAIHLACQSLRQNECAMALAGGVNAILTPQLTVTLAQARMLASDGRCKTFSRSADGFVRSEGCGVVVLKRLADAEADGDRIYGLIRGSALNHDGRSSGLTAPNGPSQEAVIKAALDRARLGPEAIDYVEAHGTGTVLGDAIELTSLAACFAARAEGREALLIGSVKTNVGHLEAAAGVAAVIKVLLALQHESVPAHLHVSSGSENDALRDTPLKVPLRATPWPIANRPRVAGVSSFGFSGTNAHLVIEEAPLLEAVHRTHNAPEVITVSAKSAEALAALCGRHGKYLREHPQTSLADFAFTLNAGRSHFQHRIALLASSVEEAAEQLSQLAELGLHGHPGLQGHSAYRFVASYEAPAIAFLFTGQGSQYPGMGRALYESNAVFRAAVDECDSVLNGKLAHKLSSILCGVETIPGDLIHQTQWTQPALFAFEYALAQLWLSWGVRPSVVAGHSLGEYVAACIAGVFPLGDALTLAYERGRLMATLPAGGAMLAVRAGEAEIAEVLREFPELGIAAVNGGRSVAVSGAAGQIERLRALLTARGTAAQPLTVSHAFHSVLMEPILDEFQREAAKFGYYEPAIPLISNVTGQLHKPGRPIDPYYWRRHIRETVRFSDGLSSLLATRPAALLEIGPDPVLLGMAKPDMAESSVVCLPSLRRGRDAQQSLNEAARPLYLLGAPIDWKQFYSGRQVLKLGLPTYPFQRQRYWIETAKKFVPAEGLSVAAPEAGYDPLLYTTEWQIQQASAPRGDDPCAACMCITLKKTTGPDSLSPALQAAGVEVEKSWAVRGVVGGWLRQRAKGSAILLDLARTAEELPVYEATLRSAVAVLELLQEVIQSGTDRSQVWLLTRGAAPLGEESRIDLPASATSAMARTARLEYPELQLRWVDLPAEPEAADLERLAQLVREGGGEPSLAIRGGEILVPRLIALSALSRPASSPPSRPNDKACELDPGAAYLVTGAYGGLGFRAVQWMADRGATRIFMVGRNEPSRENRDRIGELRSRGVEIHELIGDVSERADVARIFDHFAQTQVELKGVIHAAGVVDDGTIVQQNREKFMKTFAAKVLGGWLLHEFSRNLSLDFFVLYGSAASTLGSPGQINHAAANGFLDALSHCRRQEGLASTTIAWGAWSEIGAATRLKNTGRSERLGLTSFPPDKGIELLEQAMSSGRPQVTAVNADWRVYLNSGMVQADRPFFEKVDLPEDAGPVLAASVVRLKTLLEDSPVDGRLNIIKMYLNDQVVDVLGLNPGFLLRDDQPFSEHGLDSLMAVQLKNELQAATGLTLPPNFLFEYRNLTEASTFLDAMLVGVSHDSRPASDSSEYEELAF
jgi:acyl transferase domain-containing protein/acyl carrier protein